MIPKVGQMVRIKFGDSEPDVGVVQRIKEAGDGYWDLDMDMYSYHMKREELDKACTLIEDVKCDCYHESDRYKPYSDGECWGTKEKDPCNCGGDKSRCEYYPEKPSLTAGDKFATEPIYDLEKVLCIDNNKPTITPIVDIHKIIDDAMEKKDRAVHIFITDNTTSVDVIPYEGGMSRWIFDRDYGTYECSECHNTNAYPAPYCPECGEKLAAAKEDKDGKD